MELENVGRLTSLADQAGTGSYAYDPLGRIATETRVISGISKSIGYAYNLNGSLKSLTYPSGRIVTYTPDSAGRVTSAKDGNGTNYVSSAAYNAPGSVTSLVDNGNISSSFLYNPRLQLCRITAWTSGSVPTSCNDPAAHGNLMDRGYNFSLGAGDNGNVLSLTNYRDQSRNQNFTYDALNRITSGWTNGSTGALSWGENYTIDAWGNLMMSRMAGKAHGGAWQCAGDASNRANCLSYDAAGNVTANGGAGYTYDAENRLATAGGMTYLYDADGNRVKKSSGSTGTLYWYGSPGIIAESDLTGALKSEYVFFGGKRVARVDLPANSVHYYLSDHLGSTSMVVSSTGVPEEESDYSPFGSQYLVSGASVNRYRFTGKERDSESGLDNFGARYDSSSLGRFMTPDSASYSNRKNPQSWNLYAYALNNPVSFRDADGHEIVCANNAAQCQKDAAAATGNAEAAKRVTTNTETTKHSFLGIHWTTSKTTIGITGDMKSFRALGQNASRLADLVSDKQTITVSYDQYAKPSFWAGGTKLSGGSTSYVPSQGYDAQVFIDPERNGGTYDPDATGQNIPQANTAEEFGHEALGHVWGELNGGDQAGTRANMRDSITGENAVRALDPTRGQKGLESHHNYQEMPPDPPK